jgi:chemosensory pili system protein ChpA (sensor histidine kinase/response regulator)
MSLYATDGSLKSLKEEVESRLQQVQSDLGVYLEDPAKAVVLDNVAAEIDQIRDAFAKMKQADAALLTEEIIALARDLAHANMRSPVPADQVNALLCVVVQIPQYLDWLQRGSKWPFDLLPLINQVRVSRGSAPIERTRTQVPPSTADSQLLEPDLRKLAARLRPALQRALLGILRGQIIEGLSPIINIFAQFKEATAHETSYHFWWLAGGLMREVQNGAIPHGRDINLLLRGLDGQLRFLLENGRMFPEESAALTFCQKLIDYLSSSDTGKAFLQNRPDYHPPQLGQLTGERDLLKSAIPPDLETLLRICDSLKESLALVRDAVDRYASDKLRQAGGLKKEVERLREVANVMVMLDMDVCASLVQRHLRILQEWSESDGEITEEQLSQLACELILVEDSLESVGEFVFNRSLGASVNQNLNDSGRVNLLRQVQRHQARLALAREAIKILSETREWIIAFNPVEDEASSWVTLQSVLSSVSGTFAVLECERAVMLVSRLGAGLKDLGTGTTTSSAPVLSTLVDIILALEYCLELLGEGKEPQNLNLNYAEEQINLLLSSLGSSPTLWETEGKAGIVALEVENGKETSKLATLEIGEGPDIGALDEVSTASAVMACPEDFIAPASSRVEPQEGSVGDEASVPLTEAKDSTLMAGPEMAATANFERADDSEGSRLNSCSIEEFKLVESADTGQTEQPAIEQRLTEQHPLELPMVEAISDADGSSSAGSGLVSETPNLSVPKLKTLAKREVDPEFLEVFLEEAREELLKISEHLITWGSNLADSDALSSMRRSFHTLKGSGRMVEQFTISELAWCFEDLLNHVLEGRLTASPQILEAVDQAQLALTAIVSGHLQEGAIAASLAALEQRVENLLKGEAKGELGVLPIPNEELGVFSAGENLSEKSSTEYPEIIETVVIGAAVEPLSEADEDVILEPAAAVAAASQEMVAAGEADPELLEVFQCEAAEILDTSDDLLQRWNADRDNYELLNNLRREMHTLKGSSRMAGLFGIGDLAHAMESVLDAMATHSVQDLPEVVSTLQQALDGLSGMLAGVRGGEILPADNIIADLKSLLTEQVSGDGSEPPHSQQTGSEEVREQQEPVARVAASTSKDRTSVEVDPELVEAFLYEAMEILDASDGRLQGWSADPENMDLLNDLRREIHTLKGGARMAGFLVIGDLAHALEAVLDRIAKGTLKAATETVNTLQRALDRLNDMVARIQGGGVLAPADDLAKELRDLLGEVPEARPSAASRKPSVVPPERGMVASTEDTIRVSAALLNTLVNDMGESSIFRARIDQGVGALRFNLSELNQTVFRLRQQLRRMEIETEAQILFRYDESSKEHRKDFDPLELDRFSELQQLSRSLMETIDDLSNIQSVLEEQSQEISFLLEQQARVNKEVQQGLLQTRMVRFSSVVPRLRRVVRQAAQELGKHAELVLEGSESEVDRTVLESMVAPLEHMLRNAISHGIEGPAQRLASGKPETGTITLTMRREGAELVLNLRDDGAGLNFDAIRAKGETIGMLPSGKPVSEDELITLLLRPGFSTATKVTQISGRGVGLDVLNEAVKSMRGTLLRERTLLSACRSPWQLLRHYWSSLAVTPTLCRC